MTLDNVARSRLENTGEDWSSLLVSLRELSDWVAKQEAELLGLAPVGGDEILIRKQQVRDSPITISDVFPLINLTPSLATKSVFNND